MKYKRKPLIVEAVKWSGESYFCRALIFEYDCESVLK